MIRYQDRYDGGLIKKRGFIKFIDLINDMYDKIVTNIRTWADLINDFFLSQLI